MREKVRTLFVGLNTVDLQFLVDSYPEPNSKTKARKNEICAGGPATNAAITHAFLGGSTVLFSPIGKHSLSKFLVSEIQEHDVEIIDPIKNLEGKPTFASIITEEINGERTIFSYHPQSKKKILGELEIPNLDQFSCALFDGFFIDLAIPIAKCMREKGITTVMDGGSWKPGMEELLPYIDFAICSNDFQVVTCSNQLEVAEFMKSFGVQEVVFTNGEHPIMHYSKETVQEIEVKKVEAVDTLGAGDVFHGAFCYFYAVQPSFELALKSASIVAAKSCEHFGTRTWMESFSKVELLIP